jgi:flavin reductase (DIM6/NTAB) family NADH-FMN oxidoreductase RutF
VFRQLVKHALFGPADFRQQCALGLPDPQQEVDVLLDGLDVTQTHVMASGQPLIIGVALPEQWNAERATLVFQEHNEPRRLLGKIDLRLKDTIGELRLFDVTGSRNHCVSSAQLWRRDLASYYERLRQPGRMRPTTLESHCLAIFYLCPRPVVLVSVMDGARGNIFPMDLIGPLGPTNFSLALHNSRAGVPLIQRSRKVAISGIPINEAPAAYALGKNHRKAGIDWNELPFATNLSSSFHLPVPDFALRVREMEITAVRPIASYTLFLARIVSDKRSTDGLHLHFIHGFYEAWCRRTRVDD